VRGALIAVAVCVASGCAATGTIAIGEHARAAIAQPASCPPGPSEGIGTRTTVTEAREGQLGPDNVTTTTTTEPAFEAQAPLQQASGAKVSETAGGVLKSLFGILGGLARGALAFFVPGAP